MKFGTYEISRLIAGYNPFYGFAHFNDTLSALVREYYPPERVGDVLHRWRDPERRVMPPVVTGEEF